MRRNKKVMCNVCYREMRSDVLKRHMKQHSKKNESVPATNIGSNVPSQNTLVFGKIHWFLLKFDESVLRR